MSRKKYDFTNFFQKKSFTLNALSRVELGSIEDHYRSASVRDRFIHAQRKAPITTGVPDLREQKRPTELPVPQPKLAVIHFRFSEKFSEMQT
jgi:hypothetical protein